MTCGNCSSKNDNYVIINHLQAFPGSRTVFDSSSLPADKWAAYTVIWTPGLSVNWTRFWFRALRTSSESWKQNDILIIFMPHSMRKHCLVCNLSKSVIKLHKQSQLEIRNNLCPVCIWFPWFWAWWVLMHWGKAWARDVVCRTWAYATLRRRFSINHLHSQIYMT